jgi:hypothetical protein
MTAEMGAALDYVDATGDTILFDIGDVAKTTTVTLNDDTGLEDLEYFNFVISVSSTTAMVSSVSANANTAKIFIIDRSCKFLYLRTALSVL